MAFETSPYTQTGRDIEGWQGGKNERRLKGQSVSTAMQIRPTIKVSFRLYSNAKVLLIKQKSEGKCRFGSDITQLVILEGTNGEINDASKQERKLRILLIYSSQKGLNCMWRVN